MVDIHSHILPGLDDGSKSFEESLAMLRMAAEAGTTDIVATPHADLQFQFQPELTEQKIAELNAVCGGAPRIHYGCDFHLYYDNIQDALVNPGKYTIAHKSYLLVEFSDLVIIKGIEEVFRRMRDAGIVPVITHPERNFLLQRRIADLEEWVLTTGCLVQVTAQSFLGRFGAEARDCTRELMKRNLVHFVASDAHGTEDRTTKMDEAFAFVARKYGEPRAERLFVANPAAALAGLSIDLDEPVASTRRKWYQFW